MESKTNQTKRKQPAKKSPATKLSRSPEFPIFLLFCGFVALLTLPLFFELLEILFFWPRWSEKTFIAIVFLYLFFKKIKNIQWEFDPTYQTRYLLLAIFTLLVGYLSGTNFVLWIGLGFGIYSILIYFFGHKLACNFIPLLCFLIFLGRLQSPTALHLLSLYMRLVSTTIAVFLLNILQIEAISQGSYILTSRLTSSVGPACSGLNNLSAIIFLTLVLCYLKQACLKKTALLVSSAFILAILANSLRIATLVIIGYFGNPELIEPRAFLHLFSGVFWFMLAFLAILGLDKILKKTVN